MCLNIADSYDIPPENKCDFFLNHWNQRVEMCLWGWYSIKERKVPEGFYVVHYLKPNNGYVKHISLFQGEKVQVYLKQGIFQVIREVNNKWFFSECCASQSQVASCNQHDKSLST